MGSKSEVPRRRAKIWCILFSSPYEYGMTKWLRKKENNFPRNVTQSFEDAHFYQTSLNIAFQIMSVSSSQFVKVYPSLEAVIEHLLQKAHQPRSQGFWLLPWPDRQIFVIFRLFHTGYHYCFWVLLKVFSQEKKMVKTKRIQNLWLSLFAWSNLNKVLCAWRLFSIQNEIAVFCSFQALLLVSGVIPGLKVSF